MSIFSYFSKKNDPNYEEILTSLDKKINELETQITKIKIQHHTISASLLVYGIGGYIIYLITYWLVLNLPSDPTEVKLLKLLPIFVVPILIYLLRWVNSTVNERRIFSRKTKLQTLKKEQKLKVEELKEKTSYNSIQKMLEKFDPEFKQNELRQRINPNSRTPSSQGMSPSNTVASQGQHRGLTKSTSTPSLKDKARQQGNFRPPGNIPVTQEFHPSAQDYSSAGERAWYDKIVDVLIGEDDYQKQFALICPNCNQHNGLVSAQDYEMIQYTCPKCEKFIPSRASLRNSPRVPHSQQHPRPPFAQSHIEAMNRPIGPRNINSGSPSPIAPLSPNIHTNDVKPISEPKSPIRSEKSSPIPAEPVIKEEEEEEEEEKPQLQENTVGDEDEVTKQLLDKLLSQ